MEFARPPAAYGSVLLVLISLPIAAVIYVFGYVVGCVAMILSFIVGLLTDFITGCRFWNRNIYKDIEAIEAILQKLPELDNELIESFIVEELERLVENLNAKFSLLNVTVALRPNFVHGVTITTSTSKGKKQTKYIPAHTTVDYCLRFNPVSQDLSNKV